MKIKINSDYIISYYLINIIIIYNALILIFLCYELSPLNQENIYSLFVQKF